MLHLLALLACKGDPQPPTPVEADTDVDTDTDSDADTDTDASSPLCASVQQTIDGRCVVCHSSNAPQAGLDLTDIEATVGQPSTQSGFAIVEPYASADSYLYRKAVGTHLAAGGSGVSMPPPNTLPPLGTAELDEIAAWIDLGAGCSPETDTDTDADADSDTDADADADSDADTDTGGVDLCAEAQAVFDARCFVCHGGIDSFGGLDLTDASTVVGVQALGAPMAMVDTSGFPSDSYLWHKMQGTQASVGGIGSVMPPSPLTVTPGEMAAVEDWLLAGAGCDGADADTDTDTDTDTDSDADADSDADTDSDTDTDVPPDGCTDVQAVLDAHCTGCHGLFAVDGLDLRNVLDSVGVASGSAPLSLVEPGDSAASYLIDKMNGTHLAAGGVGVQMPPGYVVPAAEIAVVADWIDGGATCAVDPGPPPEPTYDPNTLDQDALFTCSGQPASSEGRLRRIDKLELRRRAGQEADHALAANPFETPGALRFSTYSQDVSIDIATLDLYFDVLAYAGDQWVGAPSYNRDQYVPRTDTALNCMYNDPQPATPCIDYWVRSYLQNASQYGLPTQAEVDRLVAFSESVFADELANGTTRAISITQITSAAWLHTSALFQSELGAGAPDAYGRRRLTDHEAASLVADMISDRGPGASGVYLYDNDLVGNDRYTEEAGGHLAAIAAAGNDGSIQQPAVAGALLRQYAMGLDPDREDEWIDYGTHSLVQRQRRAEEWMSDKIDRFFLEYFDVQRFESGFQDSPNATSAFAAEAPSTHQRSLDELRSYEGWNEPDGLMIFTDAIAKVVVQDQDVIHDLLTTRDYYVPATSDPATDFTNRMFGLTTPIPADRAGRWNTMPATDRAGILTHPVWLAAHGDAFEDGPSIIHRGKWMREKLLCQSVPPLELVTVEAKLLPSDGTLRARDRVQQSIEVHNECMACHQYMNALGYAFETYNHAGYVRADDHGFAPDGSTTIDNFPDPSLNGTYTDAVDLMETLADSEYVKRCFIRQTFRYFAGRDETPEDSCALTEMEMAYDASGGSFVSMLEALATSDTLMYRTNSEEVLP
ncbi:MAG: DUF1588 domain-containing protein [Alphaproteobacteria bacterium]|nr:DUF1588 domain-containing protein [Alphaproteobacteria bacterium]